MDLLEKMNTLESIIDSKNNKLAELENENRAMKREIEELKERENKAIERLEELIQKISDL
ncbi:MAG: hypothetical protein R6U31_01860 [bacterium]